MLVTIFIVLSVTVALGMWLFTRRRRGPGWSLPGLIHAWIGATAFTQLAAHLGAPDFAGPFAADAVILVGAGLLLGAIMLLWSWRAGRPPQSALILHAALGGLGYLLLAGFALG